MNYTHEQLKKALAKMLPEQIKFRDFTDDFGKYGSLYWKDKNQHPLQSEVRDTELLHLCVMVEDRLEPLSEEYYFERMSKRFNWQQRVIALAKVKGIEI